MKKLNERRNVEFKPSFLLSFTDHSIVVFHFHFLTI